MRFQHPPAPATYILYIPLGGLRLGEEALRFCEQQKIDPSDNRVLSNYLDITLLESVESSLPDVI